MPEQLTSHAIYRKSINFINFKAIARAFLNI